MLALNSQKNASLTSSLNVLPCRIHYNGPARVTKRYWSPTTEKDGSKTSYFRGRKLRGKVLKLPDGYQGVVARSTDRSLAKDIPRDKDEEDEEDEDEDAGSVEEVKILEQETRFDELVIWGHDRLPENADPFAKAVEEFIDFATAIHKP